MSVARANVPLAVASGIICLVIGAGLGVVGMMYFGYHWEPEPKEAAAQQGGPGGPPGMGMPKGMMGFKGKGKGKGGKGPNAKLQLAALVDKLDVLTAKPLAIDLNADQRKAVGKQLRGLDEMDSLSEAEAGERLKALLGALEKQRGVLEAAGFAWPGAAKGGGFMSPAAMAPNPLRVGPNAAHLKSLQQRLATTTPGAGSGGGG